VGGFSGGPDEPEAPGALEDFLKLKVADWAGLEGDEAAVVVLDGGAGLTEPDPKVPELMIYNNTRRISGGGNAGKCAVHTLFTKGVDEPLALTADLPGIVLLGLLAEGSGLGASTAACWPRLGPLVVEVSPLPVVSFVSPASATPTTTYSSVPNSASAASAASCPP
jgi:hypothetical protein